MKQLIEKIERGTPDLVDDRAHFFGPGSFKVSCPNDPAAFPALAKRLKRGGPRPYYSKPRKPGTGRSGFDWAVVRRFLVDSEADNALEYMDLFGVEPLATSGGELMTRVEWVEASGFRVAVGQVRRKRRWEWTTCEPHTGHFMHAREPVRNKAQIIESFKNNVGKLSPENSAKISDKIKIAENSGGKFANLAKIAP